MDTSYFARIEIRVKICLELKKLIGNYLRLCKVIVSVGLAVNIVMN
jgi:hypothetical protein